MSYECKYCTKKLSTKSSLVLHQKTTMACLTIQESMNVNTVNNRLICEHCDKSFTKNNLSQHIRVCKSKQSNDIIDKDSQISKLKEDVKDKDSKLSILKEEVKDKDNQLSILKEEFTNKLTEISILKAKLEIYTEIVKDNKTTIDKLSDRTLSIVEDIAKQPKTSNTRTTNNTTNLSVKNNYIQNLPKLCTEESTISNRIEQGFTVDDFNNGTKGIARLISEEVAIGEDNDGFIRAAIGCTDASRKVFCYTTENGTAVTDIKATKLIGLIQPHILTKAAKIASEQVSADNFIDVSTKHNEIINIENNPNELIDILAQKQINNMNDYIETQAKRTKSKAKSKG